MIAGYIRRSKEDFENNNTSFENQKLIISQYAASHNYVVDKWFQDNGYSGYLFDRPGLKQMLATLATTPSILLLKDLSRLGRHNAKVLLLLEELKRQNIRVIAIDDHYDSKDTMDDTLGLYTWFNERYVKDISHKITNALYARQRDGTLKTPAPFGYAWSEGSSPELIILPNEAAIITHIFTFYLAGNGYRKTAQHLNITNTPTPSMCRYCRNISTPLQYPVTFTWSPCMVKNIIRNDFYTGTLRLHKRSRDGIHGPDRRIPENEQFIFFHHHPAIISEQIFNAAQKIRSQNPIEKNAKKNHLSVYCMDCGHKMTLIHRKTKQGTHNYFICSSYNTKGKSACSSSHILAYKKLYTDFVHIDQLLHPANITTPSISSKENDHSFEALTLLQLREQLITLEQRKASLLASPFYTQDINASAYQTYKKELQQKIEILSSSIDTSIAKNNTDLPVKLSIQSSNALVSPKSLNEMTKSCIRIEVSQTGSSQIILSPTYLTNAPSFFSIETFNPSILETIIFILSILTESKTGCSINHILKKMQSKNYNITKATLLPFLNLLFEAQEITKSYNAKKSIIYKITNPSTSTFSLQKLMKNAVTNKMNTKNNKQLFT